jgi:formylglycine-generating enzyme required for sulfatase activity
MKPFFFLCLCFVVAGGFQRHARADGPAASFTNSLGMKFAWIPPGTFMMGSPKTEEERNDDEIQRNVTLTKGFYMGVHTVTQEEWMKLMEKNPSKFTGAANLPVEQVNWNECQEFIAKLAEKEKKPYRLPTEAEWEYACRAGTTTPFYFGETISTDQANYNGGYVYGGGKQGVYREKTMPVGSFPPNAWGLFDMHGNVWQWCEDWLEIHPKSPKPEAVTDPLGKTGNSRVLRGGSWIDNPLECRSAYRGGSAPALRHSLAGFRVCFSNE